MTARNLRAAIVALMMAGWLNAQTPTLLWDSDQLFVDPGSTVVLEIKLSSTVDIAALQFDAETSSGQALEWGTPLANKAIHCSGKRCLIAGLNADPIAPGVIARASFIVNEDTSFNLSNLLGATPAGQPQPILAGEIIRVALFSPYDLNRDGALSIADFDLSVNRVLLSADLTYNVKDLQVLANAVVAAGA